MANLDIEMAILWDESEDVLIDGNEFMVVPVTMNGRYFYDVYLDRATWEVNVADRPEIGRTRK